MAEIIVERIIGLVACLMCAIPLLIIGVYEKNSREPINFWSWDKSLKFKVTNIPQYNKEMASLYRKCAMAFVITGASCLTSIYVGAVLIGFDCTLGIYITWRVYKKILNKYS